MLDSRSLFQDPVCILTGCLAFVIHWHFEDTSRRLKVHVVQYLSTTYESAFLDRLSFDAPESLTTVCRIPSVQQK